jgi:hypothetical protein
MRSFPRRFQRSRISGNKRTGEIKRRPEVETLLVTRNNRPEVMRKVLDWVAAWVN